MEGDRQMKQVNTLLKTLFLLSHTPVNVFILNNDESVFNDTVKEIKAWGVKTDHILRYVLFYSWAKPSNSFNSD